MVEIEVEDADEDARKTTLETHLTLLKTAYKATGDEVENPRTIRQVPTTKRIGVGADEGPVVVRTTTLKIPHWSLPSPSTVQTMRYQQDYHQVKNLRGDQKTALKVQTLTARVTGVVVVDLAVNVDVLGEEDDAADEANHALMHSTFLLLKPYTALLYS